MLWKKNNNSKLGTQINFKITWQVDIDMLHIFAIKLNLYL